MKCRVCGKEYEACHSAKRVSGVFRWQDVACSPECGAEYLKLIRESRSKDGGVVSANHVDEADTTIEQEYLPEPDDDTFDDAQNLEIDV